MSQVSKILTRFGLPFGLFVLVLAFNGLRYEENRKAMAQYEALKQISQDVFHPAPIITPSMEEQIGRLPRGIDPMEEAAKRLQGGRDGLTAIQRSLGELNTSPFGRPLYEQGLPPGTYAGVIGRAAADRWQEMSGN